MVTLWQKAGQFDPARSSLGTWLFRIARNRLIDHRRRLVPHFVAIEHAPELCDDVGLLDVTIDDGRRDTRVRKVLEDLPEDQRQVVVMAFYEGLSQSEIAARTGLPLGTVKSRMRLAFNRLRKAVSDRLLFEID